MEHWRPNRVLYVVDHRQSEHFDKLFAVAERMGYHQVQLVHVSFGTVMGNDGKPFKTREGDTVGLEGLIDDAVAKALEVVAKLDDAKENGPEFSEEQRRTISEIVGVGALKYGDLSQNRTSDYRFDFDQMVALEGNTATYLQYSFARVSGIFAKAGQTPESIRAAEVRIRLNNDAERTLLLALVRFQDALEEVLVDYRPNLLCNYLFELTQEFFRFYNRPDCRVVGADPELQASRLAICDLMSRTIKTGLALLGIQVVGKM
jgi:arginyl-tRNA synthetase